MPARFQNVVYAATWSIVLVWGAATGNAQYNEPTYTQLPPISLQSESREAERRSNRSRNYVTPVGHTEYDDSEYWDLPADAPSGALTPTSNVLEVEDDNPSDQTYEERLQALEQAWQDQKAAAAKKKGPTPGKPTLNINGRIHADHWSFADDSRGIHFFENPTTGVDPEDRYFFRRIRLKFEGEILDNMLYRMQIDFNSPDSGEMKDMYIGWDDLPVLGRLLVGNQKRPLGLDHLNSSRFNIFMERPLVVEAFNEDARRFGIAAYNVSDDERYNWRYGAYALENMVTDGEIVGDSRQWSVNARLASSPWYDEYCGGRNYFHWAIAGMAARPDGDVDPNDTNANEGRFRTRAELRSRSRWIDTGRIAGAQWYEILAFESILNVGPLQVVGEYQSNWMQRDNTTAGTGPDLYFHGGYIYAAYMLTGEHVPLKRKSGTIDRVTPFQNFFLVDCCDDGIASGWGAWQVALRYSYLDLTDNDVQGGIEENVTLGLVWYFNANSSLQFNAIWGDIRDHRPVGGFTGGDFTALGTRLRINF
ncbi:MAG: ATPase [Planctomycetaceae bacterium]|nr:ATPase [Planctomycetaceae bacterium]MBT6153097.1 ATPase [Planctomycetaceae bacterium]MBT6484892.1 ATPase [Planctomycetaceae bacterium]MBT6495213.1 ATPase [Planctomycetaceae bacterium]